MSKPAFTLIPPKYRQIVLAVAAFLVFDLGVLILNFYTSFQIAADAVSINLAGRERMLSQRMTKSLLILQADARQGNISADAVKELASTTELFNSTLIAFQQGGTVKGGDGQPVALQAVATDKGRDILQRADAVWQNYFRAIQGVIANQAGDSAQLDKAVTLGRENNVKLLGLMNELTTHLENEASAKASRLRMVQTVGIGLALFNFAFILLHFIRHLRQSDQVIEAAQQETQEILSTVQEGLFLLGRDFRIGTQVSASLPAILGDKAQPGADLFEALHSRLDAEILSATRDYIELLFGERVKEGLMKDLNPLNLVEMQLPNERGQNETRFISVQFSRVLVQGKISHLLVTVQDVSREEQLKRELASLQSRTHGEVEALLKLLTVDPVGFMGYLDHAHATLVDINRELQDDSLKERNYTLLINGIFRKIHGLKGDAAMLRLDTFEELAHDFETTLRQLRDQSNLRGEDLLAIPLKLDAFIDRIHMVRDIANRMQPVAAPTTPAAPLADSSKPTDTPSANLSQRLQQLGARIARDQGKQISVQTELDAINDLPEATRIGLSAIMLQLLRNAATHGIETPDERSERAKSEHGTLKVSLHRQENGEVILKVRDDGQGIQPARIRQTLIQSGRYTAAQVAEWDDRQVVMQIFEPGFSTRDAADRDAGQGVGLDMVKAQIAQLGARLRLSSLPHQFTEFSILLPVAT